MPEDRSTYIGGSDAPKIMCATDFGSRRDVWDFMRGKKNEVDLSDNRDVQRGNKMESICLDMIAQRDPFVNGALAFDTFNRGEGHGGEIFLRYPEENRIGGHVDGIGREGNTWVLYEVKSPKMAKVERIKKYGLDAPHYEWQVQHYLMIMQAITDDPVKAYIVIFDYDAWKPLYIPVDNNVQAQYRLFQEELDFLASVDIAAPPPTKPFDNKEHFQVHHETEANELLKSYHEAHTQFKDAKKKKKELKPQLLAYVNDKGKESRLITEDYMATVTRNWGRYDATRLSVTKR